MPSSGSWRRRPESEESVPTSCSWRVDTEPARLSVSAGPEWHVLQDSASNTARPRSAAAVSVPSVLRCGLRGVVAGIRDVT